MSVILRKVHFFEGRRTFLELSGEPPRVNERGYANEGNVLVRIGDEIGSKGVFKLSVDEARSMRDALDTFLKKHDISLMKMRSKEGSTQSSSYAHVVHTHPEREEPRPALRHEHAPTPRNAPEEDYSGIETISSDSFSIFGGNEEKKEKPKPEFYY